MPESSYVRAYVQCHSRMGLLSVSGVTVDPTADRPVYKQLADLLRDRIHRGELLPGQRLPAEHGLAQEHGISRDSVRKAMQQLRAEGLITTELRGSYVRERGDVTVIRVEASARVESRMPTPDERRRLDIPDGVPVFVVTREGQEEPDVYAADRHVIEVE